MIAVSGWHPTGWWLALASSVYPFISLFLDGGDSIVY